MVYVVQNRCNRRGIFIERVSNLIVSVFPLRKEDTLTNAGIHARPRLTKLLSPSMSRAFLDYQLSLT